MNGGNSALSITDNTLPSKAGTVPAPILLPSHGLCPGASPHSSLQIKMYISSRTVDLK